MASKNKVLDGRRVSPAKEIRPAPSTSDGREKWYVSADGRVRTVTTSVTSLQAMNEAMEMYSDALRRLAKR